MLLGVRARLEGLALLDERASLPRRPAHRIMGATTAFSRAL